MSKTLDLRRWIVGASVVVIIGAVIAGFVAIGGPGDARALRIDQQRLDAMAQIAGAAQCAYVATGAVPARLEDIEPALASLRTSEGPCRTLTFAPDQARDVRYFVDGVDHIRLCATFERPSPPRQADAPLVRQTPFPELDEPRATAGEHCYRVRLASAAADAKDSR